ncbi:MAG: hypothetical protein K2Q22_01355, partial [Cytophagales bacterium]|nr:hypothetical protein [Cytophagales bacterium]
ITPEVEGTSLNNYTLIMFPGNLYIKYGLTVAAMNFTRNYGMSNPVYTGTVTGIQPNGTGVTVRYTSGVIGSTPVGTYTIDPKVSGSDADKYVITTISGIYTILPAPLTVSANNFVKLQGDPNPIFASTIYGLINGESLFINYITLADQTSPAGLYSIIPDPSGTTLSNYNLTTVAGVLNIGTTTSNLSVTVGNYSRFYGNPDPIISGTINGLKSGDDVQVTFTSNTNASSPVGVYPISINITGTDITKYSITTAAGTMTITSAPLTVSANSYTKAYMDTIPTLTGSISGLKNGENLTVTYQTGASQISNVGNYSITPSIPTSPILSNYDLIINRGNLAITKVNLTVVGANLIRSFGQNNPQLSFNLVGFVNGENITVIDTLPKGTTVAESNSSTGVYSVTFA